MKHTNVTLDSVINSGGIIVACTIVGPTKTNSGISKAHNKPYTMSRSPCIIDGRFAEIMQYTPKANDDHYQFTVGPVVVSARSCEKDPKNPLILKVSLSDHPGE